MRHRRLPRERFKEMSFAKLIPNMLTLLGLCAGITAIRFAVLENWEAAVLSILVASLLDTLDGGMARLLGVGSSFGAELDSLSDMVSFGVAPGVVLYTWSMNAAGSIGWALVLLFCVCCALRLARFNTAHGSDLSPPWAYRYFTGIPTPAGAGMVLLPMVLSFQFDNELFRDTALNGLVTVVVSLMMVGRVPTYSLKGIRVATKFVLPVMLLVCLLAGFIVVSPWATLTVVLAVYIASLPFSVVTYRRLASQMERREKQAEAVDEQAAADRIDAQ